MRRVIISVGLVLLVVTLALFFVFKNNPKEVTDRMPTVDFKTYLGGTIDSEDVAYQNELIETYDEYQTITNFYQMEQVLEPSDFDDYDYLAAVLENDYCDGNLLGIQRVNIDNNQVQIIVGIKNDEELCSINNEMYFIRLKKGRIKDNFEVIFDYEKV